MLTRVAAALCVLVGMSTHLGIVRGDDSPEGFAGRWSTTYGEMELSVAEDQIEGAYVMGGARCPIEGRMVDGRFEFEYQEPGVVGIGWFELGADGRSFSGEWRESGSTEWSTWTGRRIAARPALPEVQPIDDASVVGFSGLWETSHGRLRLIERGGYLHGMFADARDLHDYFSIPVGEARQLEWSPQEGLAGYHISLELSDDGRTLTGRRWYRENDQSATWTARRISPEGGKTWLVVLEARWESSLEEGEYTFGEMLDAFFDRTPNVEVRHRVFNDAADFERYGREIAFLAEPVVVCVATHASSDGVTVCDDLLGPDFMADVFRFGDSVTLAHYSACLIMAGSISERMHSSLQTFARFPISGYASSVDWAGSAVIEFMYFDLIFNRGMSPEKAHEATIAMMPFAGVGHASPVGQADLRIALPTAASSHEPAYADGDNLALRFDGRDDYVEIPGFALDPDSAMTLEAWIQIDPDANPRSSGTPLHLAGPVDASIRTSAALVWSARYGIMSETGSPVVLQSAAPVGDMRGLLKHVAVVWDGSTLTLFVDGQPVEEPAEELQSAWNEVATPQLLIGAAIRGEAGEPSSHFNGVIDEVRISSLARYSSAASDTVAFEPQRRFESDEQTLVLYHFDEVAGDEVIDASPHGRNGVIHGASRVPSLLAP